MSHDVFAAVSTVLSVHVTEARKALGEQWRWVHEYLPIPGTRLFGRGEQPVVLLRVPLVGGAIPDDAVQDDRRVLLHIGVPRGFWSRDGHIEWDFADGFTRLMHDADADRMLRRVSEALTEHAASKPFYSCQSCRVDKISEFMSSADRCLDCARHLDDE